MPVLQHFYTSFLDPLTSEGGFRTKAISPGLEPEVLSAVLRLISYRIPPTLDERVPDTHPIALRYSALGANNCVISNVRSCGADENGRPGNFFAHSLILPRQELDDVHPAYLWRHANWQSLDTSAVGAIPVVARFEWRPSIDDATALEFVRGEDRLGLFERLLTVIAASGVPGGRRVVIVDTPDNVALWVGAICAALPRTLRVLVTFSTYYHDPYQSPWLVTGTTRDSTMRLGSQDFLQYFVIDAEGGRVSDQEPGLYANFVVDHIRRPGSADDLAAFLAFCDRRVRWSPAAFDGGLDRLAAAYELLSRATWETTTESELELLATVADNMAGATEGDQEQVSDLGFVLSAMRAALMVSEGTTKLDSYCRAANVVRRHDPAFENYLDEELALVALKASAPHGGSARALLTDLVTGYGEDAVAVALTSNAVANRIRHSCGVDVRRLAAVWECLGRLLFTGNAAGEVLDTTLQSIDAAAASDPHVIQSDVEHLITAVLRAADGHEASLLDAALKRRRERGGAAAELVYYRIVGDLPLDRRQPWRAIIEKEVEDIANYEIECDVRRAGGTAPSVLLAWAQHLGGDNQKRRVVIAAGLRRAWDDTPTNVQPDLALDLLRREPLADCVDSSSEAALVRAAFADRSLDWMMCEPADSLRRFVGHPGLSSADAALLEMRMAIDSRRFDEHKLAQVQERLARLPSSSQYAREIEKLIPAFVSPLVSLTDYSAAMRAAYVPKHGTEFWRVHRTAIAGLCAQLPTSSKVRLPFVGRRPEEVDRALDDFALWLGGWFAFWFDSSSNGLLGYPYLAQQFFMELPATLDALRKCAQWKHVAPLVTDRSKNETWYPMVHRWLV